MRTGKMLLLLLGCIVCLSPRQAHAQWLNDSLSDARTQKGVDFVYNLHFSEAENEFREIVRLHPSDPTGYFFLAMVDWWRIVIDINNESLDNRFVRKLNRVIAVCDSILDRDPKNVAALFFKGGALGFRGRLRANRERWLDAAGDGREALPIVQEAFKIAPDNYDILLGIGIYNYYAAVIPEQYPIVKPLMMFFPKGDKKTGIQQLETASLHAKYAAIETSYFLLQLYYSYEGKYAQALEIAARLATRFPENAVFQRYVGRCHANLGLWNEACREFSEIYARCEADSGRLPGYGKNSQREAAYYMGVCAMNRAAYDEAPKYLARCEELSRAIDGKEESGFRVLAALKLGMTYDVLADREKATEQYKKIMRLRDYQKSHELATRYLKTPYLK
ncbi:MAG: tetratricopeptide repeat protein [Ignavibacteriales bacterium]|nr:tetratricopeptide repeat protein [Ignavibacteriales bacterium]